MTNNSFLVAPYEVGLELDKAPWLLAENAFTQVKDAFIYRKTVRKRIDNRFLGRLVEHATTTTYAGVVTNADVTYSNGVALASLPVGVRSIKITLNLYIFYDDGQGNLSAGANTSGSINYETGFFTINFPAIGVGGPYVCLNPSTYIERYSADLFETIMQFPKEVTETKVIGMPGTFVEGNCAFRRKVLLAEGNYRDIFTNHAEGVDIFWRLLKKNYKLIFDPALKVEHLGYPKTFLKMMHRNYHFGWSSTKLAKYTLGKSQIDISIYQEIFSSGLNTILDWGPYQKLHLLKLCQLIAFIYGKVVSSVALSHTNL